VFQLFDSRLETLVVEAVRVEDKGMLLNCSDDQDLQFADSRSELRRFDR
jgi:hypothetical protein